MITVFLSLINAGITATYVLLAVLLLRLCLKKAPKWISCLLWSAVGLRLVLPISVESRLSLVPSVQTIPTDLATTTAPQIHSGIPVIDKTVNPTIVQQTPNTGLTEKLLLVLTVVWLAGMAVVALYGVISTLYLYRKVRPSLRLRDNIYLCDDVDSPFILGILRPRIYLPSDIDGRQAEAVIAHENAHLKRKDHWWKPLGYVLLMVYWFHPGLWLAYILLCRDIELACDEKVIKHMDTAAQRTYSEALLSCSMPRRLVRICPLAFGEMGVKARIKAVLHYKKPALWILIGANLLCVVLAICFLTDPNPCKHTYIGTVTQTATCTEEGNQTFTCDHCGHSYTQKVDMLSHTYGAGVVVRAATCDQAGEKTFACQSCGATKTESIPTEAHQYTAFSITKAPTCTETGEKTGTCQNCNHSQVVEVLPANDNHDMVTTITKRATCTENGEGTNTCSRCGKGERITPAKLGHNYKVTGEFAPVCRFDGMRTEVCQNCNAKRDIILPKVPDAHRWVNTSSYGVKQCLYCLTTERSDK